MIFAQFYGAGNDDAFRREVFVSLSVGSVVTALLGGLSLLALPALLRLTQTPASLIAPVTAYLTIILVGLFACYFYNLFSGILRALGNTRAALVFLLLCVALNVLLDWLFVAVFAFGIAGAALATVLAQAVCAVCCAAYFFKQYGFLCCRRTDMYLEDFYKLAQSRQLQVSRDSAFGVYRGWPILFACMGRGLKTHDDRPVGIRVLLCFSSNISKPLLKQIKKHAR